MVLPRIPYTSPFPAPSIHPPTATTLPAAISALTNFLTAHADKPTLLITGAGISVESGLSDYRGTSGTYRLNQAYRPVFFHEFSSQHESRQRYWARSFLGWGAMGSARRNRAHHAVRELQAMKLLRGVVTQNVDSLHWGEVVELHGALREVVCLHCRHRVKRGVYQEVLRELNPHWAALENGNAPLRMNPDGDVDLPGAEYTGFRYAPCPKCLGSHGVEVDGDGGFVAKKEAGVVGVLKPGVTFFGESIGVAAKEGADRLVEEAGAVLVVGSSLATYSAWRLVREADRKGKGIGIVNLGGVRGEEAFFRDGGGGGERLRLEVGAAEALAGVVESLGGRVENFAEEAEVRGGGFGVGG